MQPQPDFGAVQEHSVSKVKTSVKNILGQYRTGQLDPALLAPTLTHVLTVGATAAVVASDIAVAHWLGRVVGQFVPATGQSLPDSRKEHIAEAVDALVNDEDDDDPDELDDDQELDQSIAQLEAELQQLADEETRAAGLTSLFDSMDEQGIEGWTREPDEDCCAWCHELADGKVIPMKKRMLRHPHDRCVPVPVLDGTDPNQEPGDGALDPAEFVPRTITKGAGIGGQRITYASPGLTITRSTFIPSKKRKANA